MAYLGIDPGATGAMALLTESSIVFDWEIQDWEIRDWSDNMISDLIDFKLKYNIEMAGLEQVGSMPGQGVASTFKFGINYGWWQGALEALGIPYVLVRPQEWQKGVVPKKKSPSDKPSLLVARRMFPTAELHLQKHHGRADALLIADWVRRRQER